MKPLGYTAACICVAAISSLLLFASGCGGNLDEGVASTSAPAEESGGISPKQFADAVHAVMMADRTVNA